VSNLVCTGAALQGSMGTTPATFSASGPAVTVPSAASVTSDISPPSIAGFGLCMSMANPQVAAASSAGLVPQPCVPVIPAPWSPGSTKVTIGGIPALDDASQCLCTWAGTITVSSAGQTDTTLS
jgi:hypothetical protein